MSKIKRRKYICPNGVVEATQFVVGDKTESCPKWRRAKSVEDKRDENARQAVRMAARILNCNYTEKDILVTLTYSDESHTALFDGLDLDEIWDAAKTAAGKRLEQMKRAVKKAGGEMKHFCVTSDLDGETGELVRVHHHVVLTGCPVETVQEKWTYGLVHTENLYHQDDYTPLAAYLLGQVRHMANRKKYSCSRNMVKPVVEEQVFDQDPESEIRVQPGAKVLDRTPYRAGSVVQYVRYKRKPRQPKRGGKKLTGEIPSGDKVESIQTGGTGYEFQKATWG